MLPPALRRALHEKYAPLKRRWRYRRTLARLEKRVLRAMWADETGAAMYRAWQAYQTARRLPPPEAP